MRMTTGQEVLILLPLLLVSVSVHETAHAVASYLLGDDYAAAHGRVSLNPIGHIDPYLTIGLPLLTLIFFKQIIAVAKPVPVNFGRLKWDEFGGAIVGAAGPFTNLLLALLFAGLFHLLKPTYLGTAYNLLTVGCELNVALMVINLIPWPPLDGSRILYAFAPRPLQELMASIESSGIATLIVFLVIFYSSIGQAIWNLVGSITANLGVPVPVI